MASRSTRWIGTALGVAAASWGLSTDPALAQPAGGSIVEAAEADDEELGPEAGARRPAGPDDRSGHVLLHPRVGFAVPFGSIAADLGAGRVISAGPAFGAHAGIGLSRVTVLELSGSYALLPAASGCDGCSGQILDLGLGFVYHAAQGLAFDPWISYGVGYRRANLSWSADAALGPEIADGTFHGLDVARIALGGDFYPVPSFGLGAFAELDVGTYLSRPGESSGAAAYGFFQFGVRLAFDPVPRQGTQAPAAPTTAALRAPAELARQGRLGP